MHPQITERRRIRCGQLIKELELCHQKGFLATSMGACESIADQVNMCLRSERLERQNDHFKVSAEKRKKIEKRWKEMEEEQYGPGGSLKYLATASQPSKEKNDA